MNSNIVAYLMLTKPDVIGLSFVLSTKESRLRSTKSFATHPADLIKIVPNIKIANIFILGIPSEARKTPHSVGHSNKNIPIGLSSLASSTNFLIFIPLYVT